MGSPGADLFDKVTGGASQAAAPTAGLSKGAELFNKVAPEQTVVSTTPKAKPHGLFGGLVNDVKSGAKAVGHVVQAGAAKTADAAESLSTGLYAVGKNEVQATSDDLHGRNTAVNNREWSDLFHGHLVSMFHEADKGDATPAAQATSDFERSAGSSAVKSATSPSYIEHHPLTAVLNDLSLVSGGATMAAKLGYLAKISNAAKVAETGALVDRGGEAAKAAEDAGHTVTPLSAHEKATLAVKTLSPTHQVPVAERTLSVPKLETPEGEGPANLTHESVQIGTASKRPLYRTIQGLHDKFAQVALDGTAAGGKTSLTAKYAEKRVAGAVGESARVTRNVREADVAKVSRATHDLDKGVPTRLGELSMFLRSANVTGKEAADYWKNQAAQGIGDRIKAGAGVGQRRTAYLGKLAQAVHTKGLLKLDDTGNVTVDAEKFPKLHAADQTVAMGQDTREGILKSRDLMSPEGLQTRLDLVGKHILGDAARPGQGFVTLKTAVGRSPQSPVARSSGNVIPKTRFSVGKTATGKGIGKGLIPVSTTKAVARGLHEALRFVNSDDLRGQVARFGSDVKRTRNDILIRDPAAPHAASELSQATKEILGRSESTVTEPGEDNLRLAGRKILEQHIPGLADNHAADRAAALGTRADEGYKWVPKRLVPDDLTSPVEARGKGEKFADTVNSAVTSATVYLKLGHLPTRLLTNLSTNAVQGSLSPGELKQSVTLAHALTDSQKTDLAAATGTHGYQALPHAGTGVISKIATKGANAWARKIDAPFRLNAMLYELRQVGIDTPEAIDKAIGQLKDPTRGGMSGSDIAKLDGAVRRANRASIMYDGMSAAEKRYVARYVWFYPWTKGAARFATHTVGEHPVKSAVGGQIAAEGSQYRNQELGPVPSYELGLTPISGGAHPLTSTFSSFTPYSTVGSVAELAAHPLDPDEGILGQLNPYSAAVAQLIAEAAAKKPNAIGDALHQAVSPTPEMQLVDAYLHPPGPNRMFQPTPLGVKDPHMAAVLSALARAAGGAAVPRPTNRSVLRSHAG